MKRLTLMGLDMALMGSVLIGCTPEAREKYDAAGDKMSEGAKKAGDAAATDAKVTGEVIKDKTQEAAQAGENATMTGRVRLAIEEAKDLSIEDFNVDTKGLDANEKTVVLHGRVKTEADKERAGKIAEGVAGSEFKVVNEITVG